MSNTDLHKTSSIDQCKIIDFGKHHHPNGNLSVAENRDLVPFDIKRVFYIYDVPAGKDRGAHAHKECWQFIIAASGALEVYLSDGKEEKTVTLNRPFQGLLVPPGIWAHEQEFTTGALCLVLASHPYSEDDYIRDYDKYLQIYAK